MSTDGILNAENVGMTLSNPVIVKRSADGKVMWVRYRYKNDNYGEDGSDVMAFRKDAAGKWRALGNRQLGDTSIQAVNARHLSGGQYTYQRNMEFWVDDGPTTACSTSTSPARPAGHLDARRSHGQGIVLKRSTSAGLALRPPQQGRQPRAGRGFPVRRRPWLGANDICVDGSQLGRQRIHRHLLRRQRQRTHRSARRNFKITVPRAPFPTPTPRPMPASGSPVHRLRAGDVLADRQGQRHHLAGPCRATPSTFPGHRLLGEQHLLHQDVKPTATVGVVGTWSADTAGRGANAWIHVKGPTTGASSPPSTIPCKPGRALAALPQQGGFHLCRPILTPINASPPADLIWRHCSKEVVMDRSLLIHVAVLLGLTAVAVSTTQAAEPAPARQKELVHMVRQDCGSCHGMRLAGGLGPALLPERLADWPDDSLVATIIHGRPGTAMPGWQRFMNEAEAGWIVARLKQGFPELD
jgi:cytochrome c55X